MAELDTKYTDELVCPWCGEVDDASCEHFESNSECTVVECGSCEKQFDATRHVSVNYSTSKVTQAELDKRERDRLERRRIDIQRLNEWRAAQKEKADG